MRRTRRTIGMGRVFRRKSRLTGKDLASWWIAYFDHGKERRESAHTTSHTEALGKLRTRLKQLSDGTCVTPNQDRITIAQLLDRLIDNYQNRQRASVDTVRGHVRLWKHEVGSERALRLSTARLERTVQSWGKAGASAATINRRLEVLRRAYRLGKVAVDPHRLDFGEVMLSDDSPRGEHISHQTFLAIRRGLPEYLRDYFEFAYLTGVRRRQLAATTWANLDTESWVLTWKDPRQVKNRHLHEIALDGRPLEIIQRRWETRKARGDLVCQYIFDRDGMPVGDFKRAWATACRRAGLPVGRKNGGYVFHNTRHTAVTNLVNAGVPAHEAMGVSGHRTRAVFDRYSIRLHEQTRAALRKTTEYVQNRGDEPKVLPLQAGRKGTGQ